MKTTIRDREKGRKEVEIEVPWEEVLEDYEDVLQTYPKVPVPGFRPGKAPKGVIEKRFRKQILDDVGTRCAQRLIRTFLAMEDATSAGPVKLIDMEIRAGAPFRFKAEFIPQPEFELPDYARFVFSETEDGPMRDEISEWLLSQTSLDVPEDLVTQELSFGNAEKSQPEREAFQNAERRVKLLLILHKIARREGIEVDDRDVEERIEQIARETVTPPRQLKRDMLQNGGFSRLSAYLKAERVLGFLIETGQQSDKHRKGDPTYP